MQRQPVKRVVDALGGQGRVILHLACGHNLSITDRELIAEPHLNLRVREALQTGWDCPFCEDLPAPTEEEIRQAKPAHQLWREAGEP